MDSSTPSSTGHPNHPFSSLGRGFSVHCWFGPTHNFLLDERRAMGSSFSPPPLDDDDVATPPSTTSPQRPKLDLKGMGKASDLADSAGDHRYVPSSSLPWTPWETKVAVTRPLTIVSASIIPAMAMTIAMVVAVQATILPLRTNMPPSDPPTLGSAQRIVKALVGFRVLARDPAVLVEVQLSWEHTTDTTWETESRIQAVAPENLLKFWKDQGGRNGTLSIEAPEGEAKTEFVAIDGHAISHARCKWLFHAERVGHPIKYTWEEPSVLPEALVREYFRSHGLRSPDW